MLINKFFWLPAGRYGHSSHSSIHSGHSSKSGNTQQPHLSGFTFEMHLGSPNEPHTFLSHKKRGVKATFWGPQVQFGYGTSSGPSRRRIVIYWIDEALEGETVS